MPSDRANFEIPVISIREVIDAYREYDGSDENKEPILYFISELTGLSVDTILEQL